MRSRKFLLPVLCCLLVLAFALPLKAADSDFPSNENLRQRNAAIKVEGFGFASGLRPDEQGKPNGNGLELVAIGWAGSGFVVKEDGALVTNYHVARRALRAWALFDDGSSYEIPSIKVYDALNDIAILKIRGDKKFRTVKLGDSDAVDVRDPVMAVGNPLNMGLNITDGKISQIPKDDNNKRLALRHTATIAPGNSGGALYKGDKVVGVNVRGRPPYAFYEAVPINLVKPLLTAEYDRVIPLAEAFPTKIDLMAKKSKQVLAKNGQAPAGQQGKPGITGITADIYPLEDILIVLEAAEGNDLAVIITDAATGNLMGFGNAPGDLEGVLLENDVNYKKIIINVVNQSEAPVNFGVSVNTIVW